MQFKIGGTPEMTLYKVLKNCRSFRPAGPRFKVPVLILAFSVCVGSICAGSESSAAGSRFYFSDVIARAEQMAHKPYQPPKPMPSDLDSLSFNQWRDIAFRER